MVNLTLKFGMFLKIISQNKQKNNNHGKGNNTLEEIGRTNQIQFITLIHKKCIEIGKKNIKTLMVKDHHVEMIHGYKRGTGSCRGYTKEKAGHSLWAWGEGLNKDNERRVGVRESFSEERFGLRRKDA